MTEDERTGLGPEEQMARDAVRRLSRVAPDPEFEQRLHDQFVTGSLAPAPRPSGWRSPLRWVPVPLAAAALFVVVFLLNSAPSWDTQSGADGTSVLLLPELIVIEATPEAQADLPEAPGRWFGRTLRAHVESGEVRFLTGPRFSGHRLLVTTPEVEVEVTGTIVSVFRDEGGTCVCVMNGTARVGTGPDDMEVIPSGKRKVIPSSEKAPYITDIQTQHRQGMMDFESRHPEMRD